MLRHMLKIMELGVVGNWLKIKSGIKLRAKAAQASNLVQFTASLAEEFKSSGGRFGVDRHKSMQHLAAICALSRKDCLTHEDVMQWRKLQAEHMYHYACCGFADYPKFHYFQHLPQHILAGGVPSTFWVYPDEAKNREVKQMWASVSKGHSVSQQILLRFAWLYALDSMI